MKEDKMKKILPLLPLRGLTVFPNMVLHFDVGREKSVKALENSLDGDQYIFLVTQKDISIDDPKKDEIYVTGTISRIKQRLKLPGNTIRVLVEGIARAEIKNFIKEKPFFEVEVEEVYSIEPECDSKTLIALKRKLIDAFENYITLSGKVGPETLLAINSDDDAEEIVDMISYSSNIPIKLKQALLSEYDIEKRMVRLLQILVEEIEILDIEKDIESQVKKNIDKMQKEYFLREQMKVIKDELGENNFESEVDEYTEKFKKLKLNEEIKVKVYKEIKKLKKLQPISAESGVIRGYLDWLLDIPWEIKTKEKLDLDIAEKTLNKDHYGLARVKERIIEHLAARMFSNGTKAPLICLVGPPGVGKTSIARSIAEATNRKYVRMSLGGVRDEAEIRGHRRTYIGAMPGRIVKSIKMAGTMNPLLLLDEVDKMSSDFRGDPASALLEALDKEQNFAFRDHFLEVPLDLSDVMFITTANSLDPIPRPLLDRMEVIRVDGYTSEEKGNIALKHLYPKQLKAHGLKKSQLKLKKEAIMEIINSYTRESGVRELERKIAIICRKVTKILVKGEKKSVTIGVKSLVEMLGQAKFKYDMASEKDLIGIAKGLAWTSVGGDTLAIEVNIMPGKGNIELTGQLGDVMKESAKIAISYIRSTVGEYGIDENFYKKYDIHIHVPEGAVPKEGPSAGVTLITALVSALTGIAVKRTVAMTGEVTLRGKVLPIGGLKEKILAAHRAGIKTVIIPKDNENDLEEIPKDILEVLTIVPAQDIGLVIKTALVSMPIKTKEKSTKVVPIKSDKVAETTSLEQ